MGDCIGMESCVDVAEVVGTGEGGCKDGQGRLRRRRERRREAAPRYPPPLSSLSAAAENPGRVLRRYYTGDGRLVIREEKAKQCEYLRAHRSGGRLTLHLVPLDDYGVSPADGGEEERDEGNAETADLEQTGDNQCSDERIPPEEMTKVMGGNWYSYSTVRNSCMFGMTVPAIRPVHLFSYVAM
ncbi:hypothetical protein NMG60_11016858 [Bertholletia excelsa]